jgi:hypothetical protein
MRAQHVEAPSHTDGGGVHANTALARRWPHATLRVRLCEADCGTLGLRTCFALDMRRFGA